MADARNLSKIELFTSKLNEEKLEINVEKLFEIREFVTCRNRRDFRFATFNSGDWEKCWRESLEIVKFIKK